MLSSGSPAAPRDLAISPESIAPTARCALRTGTTIRVGAPPSSVALARWSRTRSRWSETSLRWTSTQRRGASAGARGLTSIGARSSRRAFQCPTSSRRRSSSRRPMISSTLRTPSRGQQLADLAGHEEEEVHHVLGRALELLAQHRVLGGDAHRAGVEVALAQHHAAHRDERRGGHPVLLGSEQRGHHHVPRRCACRRRPGAGPGRASRSPPASGAPRRRPAPTAGRRAGCSRSARRRSRPRTRR